MKSPRTSRRSTVITEIGFSLAALLAGAVAYFHSRQANKFELALLKAEADLANERANGESMTVYYTREKNANAILRRELTGVTHALVNCTSDADLRDRLNKLLQASTTENPTHPA